MFYNPVYKLGYPTIQSPEDCNINNLIICLTLFYFGTSNHVPGTLGDTSNTMLNILLWDSDYPGYRYYSSGYILTIIMCQLLLNDENS